MSDDYRLVQMQQEIQRLAALLDDLKTRELLDGWGDLIGRHLALPALRAFWPMNAYNESGVIVDLSGQARHLTPNPSLSAALYANRILYTDFNGSTQYLSRADEAGLDITTGLTLGGWFWFDASGSQVMMSKNGAVGNYGYDLHYVSATGFRFLVSTDGTVQVYVTSSGALTTGRWYHIVGRFIPSTAVDVFVDGVKTTNTTSIPATIFNSSAALNIGRRSDGTFYQDGRAALCFLCATAGSFPDSLIQDLYQHGRKFFQ